MDILVLKEKLLNKKNIILIVILLIMIIVAISLFFILNKTKKEKLKPISFSSSDGSVSIMAPSEYEFSVIDDASYLLLLKSQITGSSIYVSETSTTNIRDISKFIEYDKNDYISKFPNISQVSDVNELTVQGLQAYNYNFYYKENMYVDVYWILKDSKFIIVDFNINKDKIDLSSHVTEILNSLKLN